jgi:hypothetical protein
MAVEVFLNDFQLANPCTYKSQCTPYSWCQSTCFIAPWRCLTRCTPCPSHRNQIFITVAIGGHGNLQYYYIGILSYITFKFRIIGIIIIITVVLAGLGKLQYYRIEMLCSYITFVHNWFHRQIKLRNSIRAQYFRIQISYFPSHFLVSLYICVFCHVMTWIQLHRSHLCIGVSCLQVVVHETAAWRCDRTDIPKYMCYCFMI